MKGVLLTLGFIAALSGLPASAGAATIPGQYIVVLKDGASVDTAVANHKAKYGVTVAQSYKHALKGYAATASPTQLESLRADPIVLFVEPDSTFRLAASADCQSLTGTQLRLLQQQCLPAGIDRIDSDTSSARSGDERGAVNVNVAVVDSGIDPHPDLNVAGGVNCSKDKLAFDDDRGHGTGVAGVIGARDNGYGVVGVVPGTPLWSVRVSNSKEVIRLSYLLCGVDWVTATRQDADPANDIPVANMSIEGPGSDNAKCGLPDKDAFHLAFCNSVAAGVTWVVAAGNDFGDLRSTVPAAYDEVLAATAMADFDGKPGGRGSPICFGRDFGQFGERDDQYATFSNFAATPEDAAHTIAAPGVCVLTPVNLEGCSAEQCYGYWDGGTSFASPAVAGTAALCIASGKCTGSPAEIIQKLRADAAAYNNAHPGYGFTGDPLHSPDPNRYYGFLIRAGLY